ncbi:MAG: ABC transporter permease [Fimbriimonadales bacterium]|nr:ABC transporter permease [Fimbriimonadales bacterium]
MSQILAIASTTLGEAIRRRVLLIILMVGLAFLIISPSLNQLTPRGERMVLIQMTLGILKITSAILAVTLTVYLLPNEVERRTIYTILSKPVQRYQFLLGKFFGSVGALTLMIGMMTLVLLVAFVIQQQTFDMKDLGPIIRSSIMLVFQMSLLAAVAMFFSTFVTPVVNFFLTGLVFVFGTLLNPLFEALGERGNQPAMQVITKIAHYAVPNFSTLDISTNAASEAGTRIGGSELVYMTQGMLYALAYIGILLILSVLVFDRKEV